MRGWGGSIIGGERLWRFFGVSVVDCEQILGILLKVPCWWNFTNVTYEKFDAFSGQGTYVLS